MTQLDGSMLRIGNTALGYREPNRIFSAGER
jgi:hypothetical protein